MQFEEKKEKIRSNHNIDDTVIDRILWHGERIEEILDTFSMREKTHEIELVIHEAKLIAKRIHQLVSSVSQDTNFSCYPQRFAIWKQLWDFMSLPSRNRQQKQKKVLLHMLLYLFNITIGKLVETILTRRLHDQLI